MPSKQNIEKISAWKAENVDRIVIQPRKEKKFPERLKKAVEQGKATSKQDYIITAVENALDNDGVVVKEAASDE